jgi:Na+/melibiose symporter-like transporter
MSGRRQEGIYLLIAILPAALLAASILIARAFAITGHRHAEAQVELAHRRAGLSASS